MTVHWPSNGGNDQPTLLPRSSGATAAVVQRRFALIVDHRDALLLWAGGLTYEQTAAVLQVPLNTVKVWIFRARGRLRELLG
ncbi:RNA polymerase sigma factor [Sphaerimonospora thailandensis]|uniref:RNA polymerase sigma factor 70 region 4 type 2 domain-containing protein n=1 Tax=Sphaerimonospora thailandensis TaxID=795644 RepID=A0A8J3R995_9ACTN|nr:sigma factor-like helix-turn-helix DNA-binding protein [Sphaerimonospora thailandensis]GIH70116.1 hypothetical protein Mth01_23690 [Sphaerimonospora thailandensis]